MNEEERTHLKKITKYDVDEDIHFRCLVGKVDAIIGVSIEPDPHGDESGKHSHFHTTLICPKTRIVDVPEPDRCQITNTTCPFIAPSGSDEVSPESRKLKLALAIIQEMAFLEFYGSQLVNKLLQKKKLEPIGYTLKVAELEKILVISDLIDAKTYQKVSKLRKIRNKLAHSPKQYLKFTEKELHEKSLEANTLAYTIAQMLENINSHKN